jgi:hypothetical protein
MGKARPIIHVNGGLAHQVETAKALAAGFKRHGLAPVITASPDTEGGFHVCNGPHFAKDHWPESLYIDRAYWGDPECVSVHWLKDGEKVRPEWGGARAHPELQPMKSGRRTVFLCDYGQKPFGAYHTVRYHPSDRPSRYSLDDCLRSHDIAIGRRTTALVEAHIQGLQVETDDPHSPVWGVNDRVSWIRNLSWHNWSIDEIAKGEMWSHFK